MKEESKGNAQIINEVRDLRRRQAKRELEDSPVNGPQSPPKTSEPQAEERLARLTRTNMQLLAEIAELNETVNSMRASETRTRALISALPDSVYRLSRDGTFLENLSQQSIIASLPPAELPGKNVKTVLPAEVAQSFMDYVEQALQTSQLQLFEYRLSTSDGVRDYEARIVTSGPAEVLVIVLDITKQNQTAETLRKLTRAVEQSASMVVITDPNGYIEYVNPKFTETTGYPAKEAIGQHTRILRSGEKPQDEYKQLWKTITTGGEWRGEFHNKKKNGELYWESASISPIKNPNGVITHFLAVKEDITARKEAEAALIQTAKELARSNTDLEQFAYIASHDLQEPLRMVSSYVQLLAQRYRGKLDSDADEFINFAVDGANRMQKLIKDLLAFSRIGRRGKPFEPVECETLLIQVLTNLQLVADENGVAISHDPLPTIMADNSQVFQLLQNLISNAIKFHGQEQPNVHISAKENQEQWVFSVRDNGIGIEPRQLERIFMIFQRLHTAQEYPGTGIGLAVCQRIVERHDGQIWVESQPGQGSTFYFTIPRIQNRR